MQSVVPKAVLSVAEFCCALGVGRTTAYQIFKDRKVRIIKVGRRTLIPVGEIEALLNALADEQG
jgi:excisionase family DNA binding protein